VAVPATEIVQFKLQAAEVEEECDTDMFKSIFNDLRMREKVIIEIHHPLFSNLVLRN